MNTIDIVKKIFIQILQDGRPHKVEEIRAKVLKEYPTLFPSRTAFYATVSRIQSREKSIRRIDRGVYILQGKAQAQELKALPANWDLETYFHWLKDILDQMQEKSAFVDYERIEPAEIISLREIKKLNVELLNFLQERQDAAAKLMEQIKLLRQMEEGEKPCGDAQATVKPMEAADDSVDGN